jgi:purine catabolism regulator
MAGACHAERVPALVGALDETRAGLVISLHARADPDRVLTAICARSRVSFGRQARRLGGIAISEPALGAGSVATSIRELRRSLLEAGQVADAVATAPDDALPAMAIRAPAPGTPDGWPYYRLADLRLRGLLFLLGDDPRLTTFVDRELGSLLRYDAEHDTDLTGVLAEYLAAGANKAAAAARAHLARPTLYERLRQIERILGVSLDSPESLASLQVALLAQRGHRDVR